jgi:hypothetical protein
LIPGSARLAAAAGQASNRRLGVSGAVDAAGVAVVSGAAVARGSRHGDLGPAPVQRRHGLKRLENLSMRR